MLLLLCFFFFDFFLGWITLEYKCSSSHSKLFVLSKLFTLLCCCDFHRWWMMDAVIMSVWACLWVVQVAKTTHKKRQQHCNHIYLAYSVSRVALCCRIDRIPLSRPRKKLCIMAKEKTPCRHHISAVARRRRWFDASTCHMKIVRPYVFHIFWSNGAKSKLAPIRSQSHNQRWSEQTIATTKTLDISYYYTWTRIVRQRPRPSRRGLKRRQQKRLQKCVNIHRKFMVSRHHLLCQNQLLNNVPPSSIYMRHHHRLVGWFVVPRRARPLRRLPTLF